MAIQELSYPDPIEPYRVTPRKELPANVLRSDIDTIVIDGDILIASQNEIQIMNGCLEMIQRGRTVFIRHKIKSELLSETTELPVQVHYPANSYTIIIEGKLSQTSQDNLRVIKGDYEMVVRKKAVYFSQESIKH